MDGEHGGHQRAGPEIARHPPQHQEQHDRRGGVQDDIAEMVPPRPQAVELAVEHVGEPGERMPVGGVRGGEGPGDAVGGQAARDMRVLVDVVAVVEVDEAVPEGLAKDHRHRQQEKAANAQHDVSRGEKIAAFRRFPGLGTATHAAA